jgi:hypothetical protein
MKTSLLLAALGAMLAFPVLPDHGPCRADGCHAAFLLSSVSGHSRYGILIAAPDAGCRRVRFRVEDDGAAFLGHTPPLGPGELAVVRMGQGFAPGDHVLTISAEGCATVPAATRRVVLAKLSPDHGWRAAEVSRLP